MALRDSWASFSCKASWLATTSTFILQLGLGCLQGLLVLQLGLFELGQGLNGLVLGRQLALESVSSFTRSGPFRFQIVGFDVVAGSVPGPFRRAFTPGSIVARPSLEPDGRRRALRLGIRPSAPGPATRYIGLH